MKRLILILVLLGIGIYLYVVLYKNNNHHKQDKSPELISDEYVEQKYQHKKDDRHVHFSERNTEHIIPNKDDMKTNNIYDDIFILDPIEIKNTDLTLSENEYFN